MECSATSSVCNTKTRVRGGRTFLLIFLFLFAIMLCAPKSYDDFEFSDVARGSLADILDFALNYGNGRFLGNLGGVLIQRSAFLAAGVKALTLTGLIFLMPLVLGYRSPAALGVSFLLLMGMEPGLFAQSITWNSGFGNFVPPAALSILGVYLLQRYPQEAGKVGRKAVTCLAVFLLGAASGLYAEHSTLVNIVLAPGGAGEGVPRPEAGPSSPGCPVLPGYSPGRRTDGADPPGLCSDRQPYRRLPGHSPVQPKGHTLLLHPEFPPAQ